MADTITFLAIAVLAAALVIALTHLSVWIGRRETTSDEEQDRRRKHERHRSGESYKTATDAIAARLDAITDELYARQRQERGYERGRTVLGWVTIVVAGVAAAMAFASALLFKGQLNEMQAERRPWVQLSKFTPLGVDVTSYVTPGEDAPYEGDVSVLVRINAKNIGLSPAEKVFVVGKAYPSLSLDREGSAVEDACKEATATKHWFSQTMIFPNEEQTLDEWVFRTPITDIKKARRDEAVYQYVGRLVILGKEKADEMLREDLARPLLSAFTIAGCVTYFYRNANAFGQTSFILDVYRLCIFDEGRSFQCSFDVSRSTRYKADDMSIREIRRSLFAR